MFLSQPNAFLGNADPVDLKFATYFKIILVQVNVDANDSVYKKLCVTITDSHF